VADEKGLFQRAIDGAKKMVTRESDDAPKAPAAAWTRRHEGYAEREPDWRLVLESFDGGLCYTKQKNLWRHELELENEYNLRRERVVFYNHVHAITSIHTGFVAGDAVTRKMKPDAEKVMTKIYKGKPVGLLMKRVSNLSSLCGFSATLIDLPRAKDKDGKDIEYKSLQDRIDAGAMPFARPLSALDILDWCFDSAGKLKWIKITDEVRDNYEDPTMEVLKKKCVTIWYEDRWERWDQDNKIDEGTHNVGRVPVVLNFNDEGDNEYGATPMIGIAHMNRAHYNVSSLHDEILYRQTFGQLTVPVAYDPKNFEQIERIRERVLELSTKRAIAYNTSSGAGSPQYISPSPENARVLKEAKMELRDDMYTTGMVTPRRGAAQQSADSKEFDFREMQAYLKQKAEGLRASEIEMADIAGRWVGLVITKYEPKYPTSFDVKALESIMRDALDVSNNGSSPTFAKLLMMEAARRRLGDGHDEEIDRIGDETFRAVTNQSTNATRGQLSPEEAATQKAMEDVREALEEEDDDALESAIEAAKKSLGIADTEDDAAEEDTPKDETQIPAVGE